MSKYNIGTNQISKIRLKKDDEPESVIWRAVVCQAIEDVLITSKNKRKLCFKKGAIKWFDCNNAEYIEVCSLAGVNYKELCNYVNEITRP